MEILNKLRFFLTHPIVKYYLSHPVVLFKNRAIILFLWFKKAVNRDPNFDDKIYSDIPIDIVIPAIDKDCEVLPYVIDSIREKIKHPIGEIVIISPKSKVIINLCKTKKCRFVDENTVLPITKKDINYTVAGADRSGWLFQQLLKWSGNKYVKNDYFLVADADTIFCRPQAFIYDNKVILPVNSQLCHTPYFTAYRKLLGKSIVPLLNFTSHRSLFQKSKLIRLKKSIERQSKTKWYKAIINSIDIKEGSSVSDYETYGQFVYSNYSREFMLEHWFNKSLKRGDLADIESLIKENSKIFKSLSLHSYNE